MLTSWSVNRDHLDDAGQRVAVRARPGPALPAAPRLRGSGELQAACDLDQDTLGCRRRILGENHPDTLASAGNLAADLRALGAADNDT